MSHVRLVEVGEVCKVTKGHLQVTVGKIFSLFLFFCEAQGKGSAKGRLRKLIVDY